ncbi:MAG: hypothetical protein LBT66_07650 [Methanobrevibacter sp.]|jgi:hypothetical protein|nr:hypothetical protein [Candidatus Methanovirga meridionalis]
MNDKNDECLKCGAHDFVKIAGVLTCKNCGMQYPEIDDNERQLPTKILKEDTPQAYGSKLTKDVSNIKDTEDILEKERKKEEREKEIKRLIKANEDYSKAPARRNRKLNPDERTKRELRGVLEPIGYLSDDDILMYSPKSRAASKIRCKRKIFEGFRDYLNCYPLHFLVISIICIIIIIQLCSLYYALL